MVLPYDGAVKDGDHRDYAACFNLLGCGLKKIDYEIKKFSRKKNHIDLFCLARRNPRAFSSSQLNFELSKRITIIETYLLYRVVFI